MREPITAEGIARAAREWADDVRAMTALLTRLPAGGDDSPPPRALRAMPLAGALAGAIGGLVLVVGSGIGLPALPASIAAVAMLVLVTGALHEDGLADTADGFGGGTDSADKLRVMRDSPIGSYGATALILALLARVALTGALVVAAGAGAAALAMVAAGAVSRGAIAHLFAALPPAREDGLARAVGAPDPAARWQAYAVAAALALVLLAPALGVLALMLALLLAAAATLAMTALSRRQIGGHTGDVCGATQQMAEIAVLAGLVIAT